VTETVPSYRSLLVYYDPLIVGWNPLTKSLHALWREARPEVLPPARTVDVLLTVPGLMLLVILAVMAVVATVAVTSTSSLTFATTPVIKEAAII
jgi:hypothetical protein